MVFQFAWLVFASSSLAQQTNTIQVQEANPDAFELRLQKLLTMDTSENKATLDIARNEYRELLILQQGSPRADLAMAVLLFKAGKSSEAAGHAKKAWARSDQQMLSAAQILLRCHMDARKYREALSLAKELVELSQGAANTAERKVQMAELVGSCVRLLEEIPTSSKAVDNAREKLDSDIRNLPDEEFLLAYRNTRNQVAVTLQESDTELPANKEVEELKKKLEAFNGKDLAAEQAAAMLRATKDEKIQLLEKRLNALDATLAEADKQYQQLAPLVPQAEAYVDSLQQAMYLTNGRISAVVGGRTLTGPQIVQEFRTSAAKLNTLQSQVANISKNGQAAGLERQALSTQFRLLTGQTAAANADIEAWQTRAQQQKERLQKRVKAKQDPEVLKQQIALALPIDTDAIILQLQAP